MFRKIASPKPGWFKSGNDFSEKLYMTKSQFSPVHSILIHVPCFNVAQSLSFQAKLKTSLPPEARAIGFWITSTLSILFCQLEFTAKLCAVGVHSEALCDQAKLRFELQRTHQNRLDSVLALKWSHKAQRRTPTNPSKPA
jgi:hypothetical protein